MSVGQSHPSASGKGSGEAIAVSSILHQVLLLAGDFRTAPDWAETVTMDTSPVLKAGFLMYKEAKGSKDFREFASKSFPTSPSPLASVNCCSSVSFVDECRGHSLPLSHAGFLFGIAFHILGAILRRGIRAGRSQTTSADFVSCLS